MGLWPVGLHVIIIISVFAQMSGPRRCQAVNCNCQRLLNLVKQRLSWSTAPSPSRPQLNPNPNSTPAVRAAPNHQLLYACQSPSVARIFAPRRCPFLILSPLPLPAACLSSFATSPAHCSRTSGALAYQSLSACLIDFRCLRLSVCPFRF